MPGFVPMTLRSWVSSHIVPNCRALKHLYVPIELSPNYLLQQVLLKSDVFQMKPKIIHFWTTFEQNLSVRFFKINPIWSHLQLPRKKFLSPSLDNVLLFRFKRINTSCWWSSLASFWWSQSSSTLSSVWCSAGPEDVSASRETGSSTTAAARTHQGI